MLSCDACGKVAPSGQLHYVPRGTWLTVDDCTGQRDVCSTECLVVLAGRLTGFDIEPPEPVAAKPRRRKGGAGET